MSSGNIFQFGPAISAAAANSSSSSSSSSSTSSSIAPPAGSPSPHASSSSMTAAMAAAAAAAAAAAHHHHHMAALSPSPFASLSSPMPFSPHYLTGLPYHHPLSHMNPAAAAAHRSAHGQHPGGHSMHHHPAAHSAMAAAAAHQSLNNLMNHSPSFMSYHPAAAVDHLQQQGVGGETRSANHAQPQQSQQPAKKSPLPITHSNNNNNNHSVNHHPAHQQQQQQQQSLHLQQMKLQDAHRMQQQHHLNHQQSLHHHQQQLPYPMCYTRGSLIQLADGTIRRVEDMRTEDFMSCVKSSNKLTVDVSAVVKIDYRKSVQSADASPPSSSSLSSSSTSSSSSSSSGNSQSIGSNNNNITDSNNNHQDSNNNNNSTSNNINNHNNGSTAYVTLAVGRNKDPFTVETPLEHPFFVYYKGWSSCSPDRSRDRYGLDCRKLEQGDKCISLMMK